MQLNYYIDIVRLFLINKIYIDKCVGYNERTDGVIRNDWIVDNVCCSLFFHRWRIDRKHAIDLVYKSVEHTRTTYSVNQINRLEMDFNIKNFLFFLLFFNVHLIQLNLADDDVVLFNYIWLKLFKFVVVVVINFYSLLLAVQVRNSLR